ncbi:hypothetical protein BRD00_03640 [Halobacteriales archaeon QS_8_69_26]|nr:MAG: hypothetical protein BRD00_03640 [Halobacteriales archaeon QS_8_69_26]
MADDSRLYLEVSLSLVALLVGLELTDGASTMPEMILWVVPAGVFGGAVYRLASGGTVYRSVFGSDDRE